MCEECNRKYEELNQKIIAQDAELRVLHDIVAELQNNAQRKAKKEFTNRIQLDQMKQDFLSSDPRKRTDPFNNWELVFWSSYLLSGTPRREILDSIAEVAKRANKIKIIVEHYKAIIRNQRLDLNEEKIDAIARRKTKNFLEYVLVGVPEFPTKEGPKPMTFYVATSPWAVNSFQDKVASWQVVKDLDDTPLEDND